MVSQSELNNIRNQIRTGKATRAQIDEIDQFYNGLSSEDKDGMKDFLTPTCDEYFETKSYKNDETDTYGYGVCCEVLSLCGMSGWLIFLIILIVLLVLAAAGAALWFFYLKREFGGKEEEEVKEEEEKTETNECVDIEIDN